MGGSSNIENQNVFVHPSYFQKDKLYGEGFYKDSNFDKKFLVKLGFFKFLDGIFKKPRAKPNFQPKFLSFWTPHRWCSHHQDPKNHMLKIVAAYQCWCVFGILELTVIEISNAVTLDHNEHALFHSKYSDSILRYSNLENEIYFQLELLYFTMLEIGCHNFN